MIDRATRRVVRRVLLAALVAQSAACGTASYQPERDRPAENAGWVRALSDGGSETAVHVPSGPQMADATVTWSNRARCD